jgi:hypothetical protein
MKTYILTQTEEQTITRYLQTGEKTAGYRMVLHRCRKASRVKRQAALIAEFLTKAEKSQCQS